MSFKIAKKKKTASLLLSGQLGYYQLGKVVSIYPDSEQKAISLTQKLITLTSHFRGPDIPTDIHLGGKVYTRYGSFNPVIYRDKTNNIFKYIYDSNGELVKDTYFIPFQLPKGVRWPFDILASPLPSISNNFIKNYRIVTTIKADAKGRVIKSLRFHHFRIGWCLIKEGKHDMCIDTTGRDVQDRLRWQYQLHQELCSELPLPKAYDLFQENGNTYLVMQFVKGTILKETLESIYENNSWLSLSPSRKLLLIDYLIQVIDILEKLHRKGFVHRDITHMNFIVDKSNRLFLIDMELAYPLHDQTFTLPFTMGTDGFMSPEQQAVKKPTIKEDIYGLAGLMIVLFTKHLPAKFGTYPIEEVKKNLYFFVRNSDIIHLIIECLHDDPETRPDLSVVKSTIQKYRTEIELNTNSIHQVSTLRIDPTLINKVIVKSVLALNTSLMKEPNKVWHSNLIEGLGVVENRQVGTSYYFGIHSGVSGVMHLLALALKAGIRMDTINHEFIKGIEYLKEYFLSALPNVVPGLYTGSAGVAISIASGIESGLLDLTEDNKAIIQKCLQLPVMEFNIANGVAGQGIAILRCLPYLESSAAQTLLNQHIEVLLKYQQKDGSWLSWDDTETKRIKYTGLARGVGGIIYFLTNYYKHYQDPNVHVAIEKAVQWLKLQMRKKNKSIFWYTSDKEKVKNPWLSDGYSGIAMCFIKAYEIFNDPSYKDLASKILNSHPSDLVCKNLSQAEGLTGIGEVYLEALRVFKTEEWQNRANWIANVLIHTCRYQKDETCYWIVEDNKLPTADFMIGNSGVIHFFLRYSMPGKFEFPILS